MYYECEDVIDLEITSNKYHIQRYFNADLVITSVHENLIFDTRDCIQTIFLWSSKYPIIMCLSSTVC